MSDRNYINPDQWHTTKATVTLRHNDPNIRHMQVLTVTGATPEEVEAKTLAITQAIAQRDEAVRLLEELCGRINETRGPDAFRLVQECRAYLARIKEQQR